MGVGDINLIAKIAPFNDGFTGMVHADQIIGKGGTVSDVANGGTIPADAIENVNDLNAINTLNLPVYDSHPDMSANPSGSAEGDIYFNA